ncbi:MAG: NAD(P)-dependent oxidoreductase, partial [Cohaesibacter sp.]|nr:NAD(P)-dependent oxidoreductase [Cohaesibacter sp.]
LASHIFEVVAASGQPVPTLTAIPTTDYPTPARRPINSVMDCRKLAQQFDVHLPSWRVDVEKSVLSLIK